MTFMSGDPLPSKKIYYKIIFHNMYLRDSDSVWANLFLRKGLVVFGDGGKCEVFSWCPKSMAALLVVIKRCQHITCLLA